MDRQLWRSFDWTLFSVVMILCCAGVAMIYSATHNQEGLTDYWIRQVVFLVMGLIVLFTLALFDYRNLELLAIPGFLLFIGLLVAVELFGEEQGGAQSWLNVGGTLVQPTEGGKFLLIIFLAWYLSWFYERMSTLRYLIVALILLLAPLYLVFQQPDFGMTVTFLFIGGTLILAGGVQFWQVLLLLGAGVAAIPLVWGAMQGYMVNRIAVFLDPSSSPADSYNVEHALIAIGSGGWLGKGWTYGPQNQLHFLRVRHTDFIFSVISEELGLIGAALILLLSLFVAWRLLRVADLARDQFGRLIAIGVAAIVFFQVVINIGMNLSVLPVTGLTLPFVSYGGSSLLSMMAGIGLAESIIMRHRRMDF